MRAKEFIVEQFLMEVSLENLAKTPVKGGLTLGQAVAAKLNRSPAAEVEFEDQVAALEQVAAADPTPNNAYTRWIAKMYTAQGSTFVIPDDVAFLKTDLELFFKLAKNRTLSGAEANLDTYKTLRDLRTKLQEFDEEDIKSGKEKKKEEKMEGADYIIKDPGFTIVHTKTQDANCFYGKGTKWCTTERGAGYFEQYNGSGPIYIVLVKGGGGPGRGNERKFQYHYENGEFMDEINDPASASDIALLSKHPGWAKFLNMEIKKHYEPIYNEIKDLL